MHLRLLPLLPALVLGSAACELGAKNLSDPGVDSATAGTAATEPGSTGTGATEGGSHGTTSASGTSGPATTGAQETVGMSGSTGGVALDVGTGDCDDPLKRPGVTKFCEFDRDCAIVFHQTDCCGTQAAIGVNDESIDPFNEVEQMCVAMFPDCDCAPMPTTAEDGDVTDDAGEIVVACVDNACQTSIPDAGPLQWYTTCGDPVCMGYTKPDGVEPCTPEQMEGAACGSEGVTCDPISDCNALLVCAAEDPKQQQGGCPISRAAFKTDIEYLQPADLERHAADLQSLRLATYRYRQAPADAPPRLGIILEDNEHGVWVDARHDRVDLYGYASLAVAALQVQQRQIAALQAEVERLSARLDGAPMCRP